MEDFKKIEEYFDNKTTKKPAENIQMHSGSTFVKNSPNIFPTEKKNQNKIFQKKFESPLCDLEFYYNVIESHRRTCLNKEVLRSNLMTETEEIDEDDNKNDYYFDKNKFVAQKKPIFDREKGQMISILRKLLRKDLYFYLRSSFCE